MNCTYRTDRYICVLEQHEGNKHYMVARNTVAVIPEGVSIDGRTVGERILVTLAFLAVYALIGVLFIKVMMRG